MDGPWPVLWRDADLVAIDKPAGMVVVPGRNEDPNACLRKTLEAAWGEPLWVLHRLDRDTSGVLLLARNAAAHRAMSLAFERHEVRKGYLALTRHGPEHASGTIGSALHHARKGKMRPAAPGEEGALVAQTEYDVRRRWALPGAAVALVEVRPRTGRQHQVRVHLRSIGAPLLVDPLYGGASKVTTKDLGLDGEELLCSRLTLHAARLEFVPPGAAEPVRIEAPLPADLAGLVERLDLLAKGAAAAGERASGPTAPSSEGRG